MSISSVQHPINRAFEAPKPFLSRVQYEKVASVALACIAFFSVQAGMSYSFSLTMASLSAGMTILSEKYLRNANPKFSKESWFDVKKIDWYNLKMIVLLSLWGVFSCGITIYLVTGRMPFRNLVSKLSNPHYQQLLAKNLILGPIAEEILFRGFVRERALDVCHLTAKYSKIDEKNEGFVCNIVQTIIFLRARYEFNSFLPFNIILPLMAYDLGKDAQKTKGVVSPMTYHFLCNLGRIIPLLMV